MEISTQQKNNWLNKLSAIEKAAKGGPIKRLLYAPLAYLAGVIHHRLIYQLLRYPWETNASTFFGTPMRVLLPAGLDIYLLNAKTHDSEIRLAKYMVKHLQEGQTVIDIGAHYGFFSLLAAKIIGKQGRLIAIEAAPSNFALLEKNLRALAQAQALQRAASNKKGSLTFYEFPPLYSEYNTTDPIQYEEAVKASGHTGKKIEVPAIQIDELLHAESIKPNFIKMDVEGAEALVLSGMQHYLSLQQGVLAMEYLASDRQNESHQKAASILKAAGWLSYIILADGQLQACQNIEAYLESHHLDSDNIIWKAT